MMRWLLYFMIAFVLACGSKPVELPEADLGALGPAAKQRIEAAREMVASSNDRGLAYGQLGMLYQAHDLRGAALFCYQQATVHQPEDVRWPYLEAQVHLSLSDYRQAAERFEQALDIQPGNVPALNLSAEIMRQNGETDSAMARFTKALGLDPNSVAAIAGLARIEINDGQHREAADLLRKARQMQANRKDLLYLSALAARGLGDREQAATFMTAHQNATENVSMPDAIMAEVEALQNPGLQQLDMADAALASGRMQDALTFYEGAVNLNPNHHETRAKYGYALTQAGRLPEALVHYREALRLQAGSGIVHYQIGGILLQSGDREASEAELLRAVHFEPGLTQAWLLLARIARFERRFSEAADLYVRAISTQPQNPGPRLGLALCLIREVRHEEALSVLAEARKAIPENPVFVHLAARLLAASPQDKVRNGDRAEQLIKPLLQATTGDGLLAESAAMVMAEQGHFDDARRWLNRAMNSNRSQLRPFHQAQQEAYKTNKPWRQPFAPEDPLYFVNSYQ